MNWRRNESRWLSGKTGLTALSLGLALLPIGNARAQSGFAGNAQHTANYSSTAQNLNAVHWTTSIDLNNTGGLAHYGAPVLTPANTIFVPVKTGATSGFEINAFNGTAIYSLSTDYIAASSPSWRPTPGKRASIIRGRAAQFITSTISIPPATEPPSSRRSTPRWPATRPTLPASTPRYLSTRPSRLTAVATYSSVFGSRARRRLR